MSQHSFSKVFVTGGSGFLGRNLIRHLVKDLGCEVRAIARSEEAALVIEGIGASVVRGVDLSSEDALRAAASGCDAAVHCAADVTMWAKDETPYFAINVTGTENTINACRSAGVKRFVHISTENTVLCGEPLVMADETMPYPPLNKHKGTYSRTKRLAEERAIALNGNGMDVIIIRPRLIWGTDDTQVLPQIAAAVRTGEFKWFGGANYKTSTVHVKNCVAGILNALDAGKGGEVYYVTDGEPFEVKAFFTRLLEAAGVPEVRTVRSVPVSLVWGAAILLESFAYLTNKAPVVNRGVLASLAMEITVSDAKARREIGYKNVISVDEGVEELRQAFAAQGRSILDK